jgi:hypothetical protein
MQNISESTDTTETSGEGKALQRVAMTLTPRDIRNTEKLKKTFDARSNAQAVSTALSLAVSVSDLMMEGNELLLRAKDGTLHKVVIPGLE